MLPSAGIIPSKYQYENNNNDNNYVTL